MLKQILNSPWLFSFLVSWLIFFLLVDWKTLKVNVWGGVFAVVYELYQDINAVYLHFYQFEKVGIPLLKTSFFFTFGVVFVMGIIFFQYMPSNPWLQLVYVLGYAVAFLIFEIIEVKFGTLVHLHWHYYVSIFDNVLIFANFLWLNNAILVPFKQKLEMRNL